MASAAGKVGTAMHGTAIGNAMDRAVDKIEPNIPQDMKQLVTREAIAGIIVAAFALTFLLICCCCICLRCRRHAKRTAPRRRSRREVAREQNTSLVDTGNDFVFEDDFDDDDDDPGNGRLTMRL
tara:strand:+ start:47 stop:418 length:372 start_codon:yes stop_codon:yes gene_type:complete